MSEGFNIRFLEISEGADEQLSPGEQVEKAVEQSGENSGSVYYDGGSAFMNVSSPAPDDLTGFINEVREIVRVMKEHQPDEPESSIK
jgi:hypothetical protein